MENSNKCPKCGERYFHGSTQCPQCDFTEQPAKPNDFSWGRVFVGFCIILPLMVGAVSLMPKSSSSADDAKTEAGYQAMATQAPPPPPAPPTITDYPPPSASYSPPTSSDTSEYPDPDTDLKLIKKGSSRSEYGNLSITGKIKNTSDYDYDYVEVDINLYDKHGDQCGDTMTNTTHLEAGRTWAFSAMVLEEATDTYRVVKITGTPAR
jgi:hypothetical protein